jgi:hypothetical protein
MLSNAPPHSERLQWKALKYLFKAGVQSGACDPEKVHFSYPKRVPFSSSGQTGGADRDCIDFWDAVGVVLLQDLQ